MLKTILASLAVAFAPLCAPAADADDLGPNWTETRAKWFAIGDKAIAGDRAAKAKLNATFEYYFNNVKGPGLDPGIERKDVRELAPALMNYRYMLFNAQPGMPENQRGRVEDLRAQILSEVIRMDYPLALGLSLKESDIQRAAQLGVTASAIAMARLYMDLIGNNNAPGTDAMLAQLADYYAERGLRSAPSTAERSQLTEIRRELAALNIPFGSSPVSVSAVMNNELDAIARYVESRRSEGVLNFAAGCPGEPSLPSSVSGYSRDQMRDFVSSLNAYVEWANCLSSNKSILADQYNQSSAAIDLPPLSSQKDPSLKVFMDKREALKKSYVAAAIREAQRDSFDAYEQAYSARSDRIAQAKTDADRRYDELDRSSSSSRSSRPRTSRPEASGPSEADRFFANQQRYQQCMWRASAYPAGEARLAAEAACGADY